MLLFFINKSVIFTDTIIRINMRRDTMIKIEIGNIERSFENNKFSIDEFNSMIKSKSEKENLIVTHLEINKEEYYGPIEEIDFSKGDLSIKVIMTDMVEYIKNVSFTGYTYVDKNIDNVLRYGEKFYEMNNSEVWSGINDLVESLMWMVNILQLINENKINIGVSDTIVRIDETNDMIKGFFDAFEFKDEILMGDIIVNEIVPFLQGMKELFDTILKRGDIVE